MRDELAEALLAKVIARYRYYVSTSLVTGKGQSGSARWRIPAGNLESLVVERLRSFLLAKGELLDAIQPGADAGNLSPPLLIARARHIAEGLPDRSPDHIRPLLIVMIRRVEIKSDAIEISLCPQQLLNLLAGRMEDSRPPQIEREHAGSEDTVNLTIPARLQRAGREMRMVVQQADDKRPPDLSLLRILSRAHDFQTRLTQNPSLSVHEIARGERVTAAYIYSILRLPWLAPDITADIVNGRQPPHLNAMRLTRLSARLPVDWTEQRKLLGFG